MFGYIPLEVLDAIGALMIASRSMVVVILR